MKNTISLLIIVCCLLFCLTSCSPTPAEIVAEAMTQTKELNAYEAQLVADVHTSYYGQDFDVLTVIDYAVVEALTRNPKFYAEIYIQAMDKNTEWKVFFENGWIYTLNNGNGYKESAHENSDDSNDITGVFDDFFRELPESLYEDLTMTTHKDGSRSVSLEIPNKTFKEVFDVAVRIAEDSLKGDFIYSDPYFKNAVATITVKDGYIYMYEIAFDMLVNVNQSRVTVEVKETLLIKNKGNDVQIEPMEGYEDFPLFTLITQ